MLFTKHPYCHFVGSLIIGFAIGGVKSKDIDLIVGFFR